MTQRAHVVDEHGDHWIAFDIHGAAHGNPVFLLHGTPGSRNGPTPRPSVLYRLGVRLICYDRPGYGESTRHPRRRVADAARDIAAIADELRLEEFSVVGRSGGGPHALACGALLPERVRKVAVLVSVAPSDADGLDWYDGMTGSNVEEYGRARQGADVLAAELSARGELVREDPEFLLQFLEPELTAPDRRILRDPGIRRLLTGTYAEALRQGPEGWIDDILALRESWGFDLTKIDVPVLLWHGADDVFAPVAHTRWLASQIPGAQVEVQRGAAHFDAVKVLPRILARL
ncbi:MAG TPA: alpha/beta hydrolase [Trebonia sp.]|nr:alpha/beta hydrolase [Trebonia sp.]